LSAECASKKVKNQSIIGEDIYKRKVPRFLVNPVKRKYLVVKPSTKTLLPFAWRIKNNDFVSQHKMNN